MVVLIGDIRQSRKLPSRKRVQQQLQEVLQGVNESDQAVVSPYTITLGDEFQAVYRSINGVFKQIWRILYEMHPVTIRFAIGIGEITTDINPRQAIGMDGPAFYEARKGIDRLKKGRSLFIICGGPDGVRALVNQSLGLISALMQHWEKTRFGVLLRKEQGWSVTEIAEELGISERAVYKNIRDGSLETIRNTIRESIKLISH